MGMSLSVKTPYGITAEYWHIAEVGIYKKTMGVRVVVNGFSTKTERLSGGLPLQSEAYMFLPNDYVHLSVDPVNVNSQALWADTYKTLTTATLPPDPIYVVDADGNIVYEYDGVKKIPVIDPIATAAQKPKPYCMFYEAVEA